MLDAGELPGWVQQMMGHESLQMIHEKYYSHIRNYERAEGSAFMEKVYNSSLKNDEEKDFSLLPKSLKKAAQSSHFQVISRSWEGDIGCRMRKDSEKRLVRRRNRSVP
jgi:hypothetical protein